MARREICIVGAGSGGTAMAADLALAGHRCRVFEFPEWKANLEPVAAQGGIHATGVARTGFARVALATQDLAEAVRGAELVMVCTRARAHERVARALAPCLEDGQAVVLWPGRGGSLVCRRTWDGLGLDRRVLLAEAGTAPYCCRRPQGPGSVDIRRACGPGILLAALPALDTAEVLKRLEDTCAGVVRPARTVLDPALYDTDLIPRLAGGVLDLAGGEGRPAAGGIAAPVARVMAALDAELAAVFDALGHGPLSSAEVFEAAHGETVEEFAAGGATGPGRCRLDELAPAGAALAASVARLAGVKVPTWRALVRIASAADGVDHLATGRTLKSLGLHKLSVKALDRWLRTGEMKKPLKDPT